MARWHENLSVIRWIFAVFGILVMLFAGGCSLLVLFSFITQGADSYGFNRPETVALIGGVPFLAGLLIWWLAAKSFRQNELDQMDE